MLPIPRGSEALSGEKLLGRVAGDLDDVVAEAALPIASMDSGDVAENPVQYGASGVRGCESSSCQGAGAYDDRVDKIARHCLELSLIPCAYHGTNQDLFLLGIAVEQHVVSSQQEGED